MPAVASRCRRSQRCIEIDFGDIRVTLQDDFPVELRAFETLDGSMAWRRVRAWARTQTMDVPDRLPYELLDRLFGDEGPALQRYHEPRPPIWVLSSKRSGTFRIFARVRPLDLIAYQALVDQLAPAIEAALPPHQQVGAYRQRLGKGDEAFVGRPTNDEFRHGIRDHVHGVGGYVLETDISGFFLGIRLSLLREVLLDTSDRADVVYDVSDMLGQWQRFGMRGLPQGLRASAPLGNLYLASLDRLLGRLGVPFYRWMDDMWALCETYSEARRVQDVMENHLYGLGLTLNGEKTQIVKAETSMERLQPAAARWEERREEAVMEMLDQFAGDYADAEALPSPSEIDLGVTIADHDRLVAVLGDDSLPRNFSTDMSLVFRQLEALGEDHALHSISRVLVRAPDLSPVAMRYAASLAKANSAAVSAVFADVLSKERFTRDFEKLNVCHKALSLKSDKDGKLSKQLGDLALNDAHPLVRAKALLAWGLHSPASDFSVADRFLQGAEAEWRAYALVAIQKKTKSGRDRRFETWASEGQPLADVTAALRSGPIKWTRL
jgi:hypothetical protein